MTPSQKYYAAHRGEVIARSKAWTEKNPERAREIKRTSARQRYHTVPRPGRRPKQPPTPCPHCGGKTIVSPSDRRRGRGKYCSLSCFKASKRRQPNRVCARCGTPFYAKKQQLTLGHGRFCSLGCRSVIDPEKRRRSSRRAHDKRRARLAAVSFEPVDYQRITRRDRMRCHICRRKVKKLTELHFDHVIPLAAGGEHIETNIAVSHARCNLKKQAKRLTLF